MKLTANPDRLYRPEMVRDFVKRAIDRVGSRGWDYLSRDMREALLAREALTVLASNGRDSIPCAAIHCLRMDMMIVAGLHDE